MNSDQTLPPAHQAGVKKYPSTPVNHARAAQAVIAHAQPALEFFRQTPER